MHADEYTATVQCPDCGVDIEVQCSLLIDPGVRYHADGSGTPPSEDFNVEIPTHCPGCKQEFTDAKTEVLVEAARDKAPDEPEADYAEPEDREGLEWDHDY